MSLARFAASLTGLARVPHHTDSHFPHTSHASSSIGGCSQQETLPRTQTEPITRQATTPPTTKAGSVKQPELSLDFDGGWGVNPGSMYREDNPTKDGMSFVQKMRSMIDAAAVPQDPTVEGVREGMASLNR